MTRTSPLSAVGSHGCFRLIWFGFCGVRPSPGPCMCLALYDWASSPTFNLSVSDSISSLGWPQICNLPASTSPKLGLITEPCSAAPTEFIVLKQWFGVTCTGSVKATFQGVPRMDDGVSRSWAGKEGLAAVQWTWCFRSLVLDLPNTATL